MLKLVEVLTLAPHLHMQIWSNRRREFLQTRIETDGNGFKNGKGYLTKSKLEQGKTGQFEYSLFVVGSHSSDNLNLFITLAKNNKLSIRATVSPGHLLAPIPKGMFLLIFHNYIIQIISTLSQERTLFYLH